MVVHRLDRVLARTDPFDLAQALERYVRAMPGDRIRALVIDARDRMGGYYRAEFARMLRESKNGSHSSAKELDSRSFVQIVREDWSDEALQRAFVRLLKSNLRAIPIFGTAFSDAILQHVPSDRAVALGEESRGIGMRVAIFGGMAVALVLAGAAGERYVMNVRAQTAVSPPPIVSAPPIAIVPPVHHVTPQRSVTPREVARAQVATPMPATPAPASPVPAPPVIAPAAKTAPTPAPTPRATRTPPPAQGVVTVQLPTPTAAPSVEPTDLDVSDMPDAYTDATPLPPQTAPPATIPGKVTLNTPTPKPRPRGWIKRSLLHIDPFKPHP